MIRTNNVPSAASSSSVEYIGTTIRSGPTDFSHIQVKLEEISEEEEEEDVIHMKGEDLAGKENDASQVSSQSILSSNEKKQGKYNRLNTQFINDIERFANTKLRSFERKSSVSSMSLGEEVKKEVEEGKISAPPEDFFAYGANLITSVRHIAGKGIVHSDINPFRVKNPSDSSKKTWKKPFDSGRKSLSRDGLVTLAFKVMYEGMISRGRTGVVRNVLVAGYELDSSLRPVSVARTMIITLWDENATEEPSVMRKGNYVIGCNFRASSQKVKKGTFFRGRMSYTPTRSTKFSVNKDTPVHQKLRSNVAAEIRSFETETLSYTKAFSKPPLKKGKSSGKDGEYLGMTKGFLGMAQPIRPPRQAVVSERGAGEVTEKMRHIGDRIVKDIITEHQKAGDLPLQNYTHHVSQEERVFINNDQIPIFYRSHALGTPEKVALWKEAGSLYDANPNHPVFLSSRLARLPKIGVYLCLYPEQGTFKPVFGPDAYIHNPSHKYATCFDFPALISGGMMTRTIIIGEDTIVSRSFRFKKCKNLTVTVMEKAQKVGSNWISDGKKFFVIQVHVSRGKLLKSMKMAYEKNACRSNPITRTKVHRLSATKGVRKATKIVANETHVKGPADCKISPSSIHSAKTRMRNEYKDDLFYLLNEQKFPKGKKFVRDVNTSNPKGGIIAFCAHRDNWTLYKELQPLYPEKCRISFGDTSFDFGDFKLSYILLHVSCFNPVKELDGGYLLHSYCDTYTYDHWSKCLCELVPTLDCLPEIHFRDDDDAYLKGFVGGIQKALLDDERYGQTFQEIICLFHKINLNILRKAHQLGIGEARFGRLKGLCYDCFTSKTVEEFDEKTPVFLRTVKDEFGEPLHDYILKNKLIKARNRVMKLMNTSAETKSAVSFPDHNHPIESRNRWLQVNIGPLTSVREVVECLRNETQFDTKEVFKALVGLPSELKFSEDAKGKIDELEGLKEFSRSVMASFFNTQTIEEQKEFMDQFCMDFPGTLTELGFPEVNSSSDMNLFNDDVENWKIKDVPIDLKRLVDEKLLTIDVPRTKKWFLRLLNSPRAYRQLTKTQTAFWDERDKKFFSVIVSNSRFKCEKCGLLFCCHGVFHCSVNQDMGLLRTAANLPPNFSDLYPELKTRLGGKPGRRRRKSKKIMEKDLVRRIPLSARSGMIFAGGPLLFESFLHKGRVILCKENLSVYIQKNDQIELCKKNGIKNYSNKNALELRSHIFLNLKNIAEEKCVMCESGKLGFCCQNPVCQCMGIIMKCKGNDISISDLKSMYDVVSKMVDDQSLIECYDKSKSLVEEFLACISSKAVVLDEKRLDRNLYLILSHHNKVMGLTFEKNCMMKKMKQFGYIDDYFVPLDGNCLFFSVSLQLRFSNVFLSHLKVRKMVVDWLRKNGNLVTGKGVHQSCLMEDFGGHDAYMTKLDQFSNPGVWGSELCLIGISNLFVASTRVLHANPNWDSSWSCYLPIGREADRTVCVGYFREGRHYVSLVKKDFSVIEDTSVWEKLKTEWIRSEPDRLKYFEAFKHPRGVEESDQRREEEVIGTNPKKKKCLGIVCVSCDWIFTKEKNKGTCVKCGGNVHKSKPMGLNKRCSRNIEGQLKCSGCMEL